MTENERAPGGEVFRYSRDGDVRIYSLRVAAGGTELCGMGWAVLQAPLLLSRSTLMATCDVAMS